MFPGKSNKGIDFATRHYSNAILYATLLPWEMGSVNVNLIFHRFFSFSRTYIVNVSKDGAIAGLSPHFDISRAYHVNKFFIYAAARAHACTRVHDIGEAGNRAFARARAARSFRRSVTVTRKLCAYVTPRELLHACTIRLAPIRRRVRAA